MKLSTLEKVLSLQSNQYQDTTIDIFVTEPFDFKLEYDSSLSMEILPDLLVRVVNLQTLIKMKTQAGRNRDLDDIEHLNMIIDEQNNQ